MSDLTAFEGRKLEKLLGMGSGYVLNFSDRTYSEFFIDYRIDIDAAQYRTASEPWRSRMSVGVTTLPFDFDIFLRSGSTMKPLIAASDHGARPSSRALRTIVENSQVRMMSCPCGRTSKGATRFHNSSSRCHPH